MAKETKNITFHVGQAAHNDWDWVATFNDFLKAPQNGFYPYNVEQCFDIVFNSFTTEPYNGPQGNGPNEGLITKENFDYNVCEIGFLISYFNEHPDLLKSRATDLIQKLHIVGGGITSPSSKLAFGEVALRNYLVGNNWMRANLPGYRDSDENAKKLQNAWIPDSFALDPNLPATIRALGLIGCGNSRIGTAGVFKQVGAEFNGIEAYSGSPGSPMQEILTKSGPSFVMKAADGSETIVHIMFDGYQGMASLNPNSSKLAFSSDHIYFHRDPSNPKAQDENALWMAMQAQLASDPFIRDQQYLHISEDMMKPCITIQDIISKFNQQEHQFKGVSVKAVYSSFDKYIEELKPDRSNLVTLDKFRSTPYMDGYFASCPDLKTGMVKATHALVAAEAFTALAHQSGRIKIDTWLEELYQGWQNLVPVTHHAYCTGLSVREVYQTEQRSYLYYPTKPIGTDGLPIEDYFGNKTVVPPNKKGALTIGDDVLNTATMAIAKELTGAIDPTLQTVAVFNPMGHQASRLAEIEMDQAWNSTDAPHPIFGNTVQSEEIAPGRYRCLFFANPESFGYESIQLSKANPTPIPNGAEVSFKQLGNVITLSNGECKVNIQTDEGTITMTSGNSEADAVISTAGNVLRFYNDADGTGFQFSYECNSETDFKTESGDNQATSYKILEKGPLRASVECTTKLTINGQELCYIRKYTLVAGEPFVRISTSGKAPDRYSVFVDFPLATSKGFQNMVYGTPYHWIEEGNAPDNEWNAYKGWKGPFMKGTWNFAMGTKPGVLGTGAAIYHKGVPAWGFHNQQRDLIGCLYRAVPMDPYLGPDLVDTEEHTLEYAIRIPGVGHPSRPGTNHPLFESMAYQQDLITVPVSSQSIDSPLAPKDYLAAIATNDGKPLGLLSAARISSPKVERNSGALIGPMILRVYQPWNKEMELTVLGPKSGESPKWVSALEMEIPNEQEISPVKASDEQHQAWVVKAPYAIGTLSIDV